MLVMRLSALDLQRQDFREIEINCLRSSVAISPAKKSLNAMVCWFIRREAFCEGVSNELNPKWRAHTKLLFGFGLVWLL